MEVVVTTAVVTEYAPLDCVLAMLALEVMIAQSVNLSITMNVATFAPSTKVLVDWPILKEIIVTSIAPALMDILEPLAPSPFALATVTMLELALAQIFALALEEKWEQIAKLIVDVEDMELAILTEHANAIQVITTMQLPKNAKLLAMVSQVLTVTARICFLVLAV
jgi:hypothetical protein